MSNEKLKEIPHIRNQQLINIGIDNMIQKYKIMNN